MLRINQRTEWQSYGRGELDSRPQKLFAQNRATMEVGVYSDFIETNNPITFFVSDTFYTGPIMSFPGIPSFSPDLFC